MLTALSIAGSDSGAGAGIQADLKTFSAHGVYGTTAITAITAQSTLGIVSLEPLSADLVIAQIEAVVGDIGADAVKVGMLATAAIVEAVAASIRELDLRRVVVDPVMVSTSGERLLDEEGVAALKAELVEQATVITPNIREAEVLSGLRVTSLRDAREAAVKIHKAGATAIVITGGHLDDKDAVDLLYADDEFIELRGPRLDARHAHGTGCTFAAALAANLARGCALRDAALNAKEYVAGAILHAPRIGRGRGPLNHFWRGLADTESPVPA
jgi:hydroxymethylpyrimidine/phosphomethylpyrimidine kinase